jgi:osmotically-inducible protein OsmY
MRPILWAYAIVLMTAVACDRGPDTEENVRKALEQANIQTVEVDTDDETGIVHLQGTVGTLADRTRASEVATAVVGTSGRVLNELTVERLTERRADDVDGRMTDALDQMLDEDAVLRERDVNIEVTNGMVALTGEVRTRDEKDRAERIVKAAPGVRNVVNGLRIRDGR